MQLQLEQSRRAASGISGWRLGLVGAFLVALLGLVAATSAATPAGATPAAPAASDLRSVEGVVEKPDGSLGLDPAIIEAAHQELRQSGIEPTYETQNGVAVEVYTVEGGTKFAFTQEADGSTGVVQPMLGGGYDIDKGLFVSFNSLDQQAIMAGGAAALGAAICLIPAVGTALCIATGALIAAATVYLNSYGLCADGHELRVYLQLLGYPECQ